MVFIRNKFMAILQAFYLCVCFKILGSEGKYSYFILTFYKDFKNTPCRDAKGAIQIICNSFPTSIAIQCKFLTFTEVQGCGSNTDLFHVAGGIPDLVNNWPWMVSLGHVTSRDWEHFCGASLITSKFLLSAAHCVLYKTG